MIKDGAIVWDAPCVTGNVSKNYTTPEGIYSLTYKQTDRILRGAKQADGTYEYESHVDYWMPFMMRTGEANSEARYISTAEATDVSTCRRRRRKFCMIWSIQAFRSSVTIKLKR